MPYLRRLMFVELAAQGALLVCALAFAFCIAIAGVAQNGSTSVGDTLLAVIPLALIVYGLAVVPVAVVLAPAYAFLEMKGVASGLAAAAAGAASGLIGQSVLHLHQSRDLKDLLAVLPACLLVSACVGLAVHLIRTWRSSRDNAA